MSLYVVVLNWNGKQDTLRCLESLQKVTTPHHVIVVDNGSTDGSVEGVRKAFPTVHLIENRVNLGYAEGNNVGIRYALAQGAEFLLILNNDTLVTETILEGFLESALQGEVPIQGGKLLRMDHPERLDHLGGRWCSASRQFELVADNALASEWTSPIALDYVCGAALFVRKEVFQKVGLFDPRFFLMWEEADWCYRAREMGYPSTFCPRALVLHKGSASFVGGKPHFRYFWWRNRLLWSEKHTSSREGKKIRKESHQALLHAIKMCLLKWIQRPFSTQTRERQVRLAHYRATYRGIIDYYLRRFGGGPPWLIQKREGR